MKKIIFLLMIASVVFLPKTGWATESIEAINIEFKINKDSSVDIAEEILYDFGDANRHGIYRNIPFKYNARGGNFALRISDISVTDENGTNYNFSKETSGNDLNIKIGDADKYVTGKKAYIIKYKVQRALNYFDSHDEFYWNAIGNEWSAPIADVSAKVILPEGTDNIQSECFIGYYGSQEKCSNTTKEDGVNFTSRDLNVGEGVTVVVGFPKGIIQKPSTLSNILETIKDNWIAFLPILTLLVMSYLWYAKGRDPKGRGTIVAQYEAPDNLSPLEIGTLMDENAQNTDVSSQIIDLAIRGYLKIKRIENKGIILSSTDYEFRKMKDSDSLINQFDRSIMDGIFTRGSAIDTRKKLSELKNKFYIDLKKIIDESYKSLVLNGYFLKNPAKTRGTYAGFGAFLIFSSFFVAPFLGGIGIFSIIVSGVIIVIFSFIMPAKTIKGVLAREHILGLKEYMTVAEKDRIKFHNAPEKNPERFEKLLPYAIALGVAAEWAYQFKDIYQENPNWYSDTTGANFSSVALISDLNVFSSSASAIVSSIPSSASGGGSGFSGGGGGGGFGGGGGGSW